MLANEITQEAGHRVDQHTALQHDVSAMLNA
jgi:hypothetical protein